MPSRALRPEHFEIARQMGERWVKDTLMVVEALGQTRFQRDADAVADTVRRHEKGIKLSDLYRRHRRLKQRDFAETLTALEVQDRIRKVKVETTTGRPPTIYITGRAL